MKKFVTPEIVEAFDTVEGIYLASGSVQNPPKEEHDCGNWKWNCKIESNDTGSHSDVYLRGHASNSGDGASVTLTLLDGTATMNCLKNFSLPLGFSHKKIGNTIYFTTNSHYNPNENVCISFQCVFGGSKNGSYGEGGHTLSEAEKNTAGIFSVSGV